MNRCYEYDFLKPNILHEFATLISIRTVKRLSMMFWRYGTWDGDGWQQDAGEILLNYYYTDFNYPTIVSWHNLTRNLISNHAQEKTTTATLRRQCCFHYQLGYGSDKRVRLHDNTSHGAPVFKAAWRKTFIFCRCTFFYTHLLISELAGIPSQKIYRTLGPRLNLTIHSDSHLIDLSPKLYRGQSFDAITDNCLFCVSVV